MPFKKLYPDRPPKKRPVIPPAGEVDLRGRLFASPPEAAAVLDCSLVTLERKRKSGTGPPFVHLSARRIGYPVKALLAWKQPPEPAGDTLPPPPPSTASASRSSAPGERERA